MNQVGAQALPSEWDSFLPKGSVFRAVFESSRAVMFLLDPQTGRLAAANPAACNFYGYGCHELDKITPGDVSLLGPEQLAKRLAELREAGAARFATRHRLRDGELRDMEFDACLAPLQNGRKCILFIGHDITERRLAEAALLEREGLLQAILDSASDGIGFTDPDGVYREVNPAFCTLVGERCDTILGSRGTSYFDRRCRRLDVPTDRRNVGEGSSASYELTLERDDGARHISVHRSPVVDPDGRFMGTVMVSRDITARRNAEAALRKSEGLHRAMLQSAQDSIFVTDEHDRLHEVNLSFLQLLGRTRADVVDRHMADVFEEPELRLQLSTSSLARQTREPVSFTQRFQAAPGPGPTPERWISVVKTAIVDAEGQCLGVVSMGRDITAQRSSEIALRQSERRLSGLIRQAPVGVFETDVSGQLVFANERMQRLAGRGLSELAGEGWLGSVAREDREDFSAAWRAALAKRQEMDRELRIATPQGTPVWVSCRVRPMSDATSRLSGYLGVLSDISERKKAEALRDDVESVVRHDLKSPLASVQNAMELLPLLGPLSAEQEQVLHEVRSLARRMRELITLSLDLHAMEAGLFKPELSPVDLCLVVDELRGELRGLLDGKRLELKLLSDCGEGPFPVLGERRLLDAVFSNLLKNAAEASPEGETITLRMWREGGDALAALRNLGAVPERVRARFFDKYATAGKSHGTGLGTYSARLMVRTLGGSLSVDMGEAGATTLLLRLPAVQADLLPKA